MISDELRPTYRQTEIVCSSIKENADCYKNLYIIDGGKPLKSVRDYSEEDQVDKLLENSDEVKIINELDST